MITVRLQRDGERYTGFSVRGHAGLAEAGQDILCASVSSAAYMTVNTLTDVCGIACETHVDDGEMVVSLLSDSSSAQDLLRGFALHLRALSRRYPKQLQIIYGGNRHA